MRFIGRRFQVGRAAALGAAAYLAGYLVTYLWLGDRVAVLAAEVPVRVRAAAPGLGTVVERTLASLLGTDVPATTWAGWLWSNAHFVGVAEWSYPTSTVPVPNLLFASDASWLVIFAVPPVLLAAAGALSAHSESAGTVAELPALRLKLHAGAVRGMGIWVGYLPAAVLGAFLFSAPTSHAALAPFAPSLAGSFVIAGLLYPLAFGSLGGWLGTRLRSRANRSAADESRPASR